ncbi:UNVERIFIED_CONTAM: hypothetical protein GTU68_059330, partial [Idotea baltica]|nr:hypothetical protein [Idotea baltica]
VETVLSIQTLAKHYGKVEALKGISFEISKGSIFGLLGPNGSGKTTTLGILLGVIRAKSGSFSWFNGAPQKDSLKRIGAILETPNFYPYLSGEQNLKIVADIKGVSYSHIEEVLELVKLNERKKSAFKTYSLGMKQRLAIGAAMLNNPEVLVLDEPTNGLDPQGIAEVRNLIQAIAEKGTTIILASHLLDEVQKVCDQVAVLHQGKLLFKGKVSEVLEMGNQADFVELEAPDMKQLYEVIQKFPGVKSLKKNAAGQMVVFFESKPDVASLNQFLIGEGITLSHLAVKQQSLEKQFLALIQQATQQS